MFLACRKEFYYWWKKIDRCSIIYYGFFWWRKKEGITERNCCRSKTSKQCSMAGQPDVEYRVMKKRRVCERENVMREEKKKKERRHHHQPTLQRRPTVKRQILVRFTALHFLRSFYPCAVLSLLLLFPLSPFVCAFACPSLRLRDSRFALCVSLSRFAHMHIHMYMISAQGHNKKAEEDKRERGECRH